MGPNNADRIMSETNDLSFLTPESRELTSGALVWQNSEAGSRTFTLQIKPHSGWEIGKTFIVILYDIRGFPASSGNGETTENLSQFYLTVK